MTVDAVVAAKSPGVTTVALLLAAARREPALLVEADAAGGVLGARFGLGDEPGLRTLAVRARRGLDPATVMEHTQRIGDVSVLVGPATAEEASTVLATVADALAAVLDTLGSPSVVDAGRARPQSPAWPLLQRATTRVVVCRPRLDEFRPTAALASELACDGRPVGLVCVGTGPYPPVEFAAEAGVELWGVLPDDERAAAALRGEPANPRVLQRSRLWLAGAVLAEQLDANDPDGHRGSPSGVMEVVR